MPLPAEETTKVSELAAATVLSDTDLLLITRTGANVKAALSLLLAYINDNIDLSVYAPLASPAMTGTPTAPTAEPGTDTTQLATTAFVEAVRLAIIQVIAGLTAASVGADPSGTAAAAVLAHLESADAHGDREYADGIVSALADIVDGLNAASVGADAAGTATSAVSAHSSATDPHGDREYAASVATDAEVAAKNYADLLVAAALRLRGGYDASGNAWPTTGGTGTSGAIKTGNLWFVSVPGVLGGKSVVVGDSLFAVSDAPGQTSANWCVLDTNLGFVPEASGAAAAAIVAHLLATDPHGDREYVDSVIAGKVNTSDIIDTLLSNATNKPLSAAQGKALKTLIDAITVPTQTSQLTNNSGFVTSGNFRYSYNTQAGASYVVVAADVTAIGSVFVEMTSASSCSCQLPTPTSLGVTIGDSVNIQQAGAGIVTLTAGSGATLEGAAAFTKQWEVKTAIAKTSTSWRIVGAQ